MSIQGLVYQWEREAGFDRPLLPVRLSAAEAHFRVSLIDEELQELKDAIAEEDLVEIADALGDLIWVVYGTAHAAGIDLDRVLLEIGGSNYTKFIGRDGVLTNPEGKVIKGSDYMPPDIKTILETQEPLR